MGGYLPREHVLLAHPASRVPLEVGVEDGRATGFALSVRTLAQELQCPVDAVEDGRRAGQFGFVALLHGRAG